MSDQDPIQQPDPLLGDRIGSRWIILFTVAVIVLVVALFYAVSREPHGTHMARMSSDWTPPAASGTPAPSKP